jgi:predicted metalloprotease with PDZ domain
VQSVAQSSFDAWVKYYRQDENTSNATVSYYTKGSLVALALDLTLRRGGAGVPAGATLDAVMQQLWQGSQGGPITEADIAAALQQVGGRDFAAELAAWVHGTDDLPLQPLLAELGVAWTAERATLVQRLGARLGESPQGVKVSAVQRASVAERAGLAAGDELLALDDWRVGKIEDLVLLGALDGDHQLLVARDRRLLRLPLPAAPAEGAAGTVQLGLADKPAATLRRRRDAWLAPQAG